MSARQPDASRPGAVVVGPDAGETIWQPLPSRGYVAVNLTPETMPYDDFSSGIQVLPPGCSVRQHGHLVNHELIFIYQGTGRCVIDGVEHALVPGTTVLFGRHAQHFLENTGAEEMRLFWVFFPPGLEDWFRAIGRPRTPGEPMPEPFARPDGVGEVMARMKFAPPPATKP